jgi:branched-chain amino acid aminotransferase
VNTLGLIETIKVVNGRLVFKNLHIERLNNGLKLLNVPINIYQLEDRILRLLKYECLSKGLKNIKLRIEVQKNRLHEYMPEIGELKWNITIKPLEQNKFTLNEKSIKIGVFLKDKKIIDEFSNLKHTDREIYSRAYAFATENNLNEALVFNTQNFLADATIYNVFIVKDKKIYTPTLADAPVDGTVRKLLLNRIKQLNIIEKNITVEDVYMADEIFLTNAIKGIQIATHLEDKILDNDISIQVFNEFKATVAEHYGEDLV